MIHATFNTTCTVQQLIDALMLVANKEQEVLLMLEINDEQTEVAGVHVIQDVLNSQTKQPVIGLITKDFSGLQLNEE